jgi:aspartate ammonia-lyase
MKTLKQQKNLWKIATCVALSTFYFAMLAYPFGVTGGGYVIERVLIAGAIFFAISIPVWIVNVKREFFSEAEVAEEKVTVQAEPARRKMNIGQIAVLNKWLSPNEVKQILYCQEYDGKSFEKVAVKRNFLTMTQVKALLEMQGGADTVIEPHKI